MADDKQNSPRGDAGESRPSQPRQGPFGDVQPEETDSAAAPGSRPQEKVNDRAVVGTVKPSDYPQEDRARSSKF